METQVCIKCERELPKTRECFHWKIKGERLNTVCVDCHSVRRRAYYLKNKRRENAQSRRWARENRDRDRKLKSEWYRRQPRTPGVYVIESNGLYKIGKSESLGRRLIMLELTIPCRMDVVCCFVSEHLDAIERSLQLRYWDKVHHGEWFELTPADVEEILAMPGCETSIDKIWKPQW